MKRIVLSTVMILSLILQVKANDFDIYNAFERAKQNQKPVLFLVVSASCKHCYDYLKETIEPQFGFLKDNFEFALSDISKGQLVPNNIPFSGKTPSTYFILPDGKLMIKPLEGNVGRAYFNKVIGKLTDYYSAATGR